MRARAAFLLLLAGAARAQTTGGIAGRIADAGTGAPVAEATVTATSPSLQGEETVRTGSRGEFEIGLLRPGTYTLNVQRRGYQAFTRENLLVHAGLTLRVPLAIYPEGTSGAFEIAAQRPLLDVGSAQTGAEISREQLELVPYGREQRSFEQAALSAPGVLPDPLGLQLPGAQSLESRVVIDGLDVTDPALNRQGTRLLQNFVEEVGVITGGFQAEYGRAAGGIVNVVTRSGSNDSHGSIFVDGMPFELSRKAPSTGPARYAVAGGFELGGPIQRDKLWFYAGAAPQFTARPDSGPTRTELFYIGKLTFRASEDHALSLSAFGDPGSGRGAPIDSFSSNDLSLNYQGKLLDKRFQVQAQAGWHRSRNDQVPSSADRLQAGLKLGHFLQLAGLHQLKVGGDLAREQATLRGNTQQWALAGFAQDTWNLLDSVWLDAGVRVERQVFQEVGIALTNLMPRAGLTYDFTGRGLSKVYASFGRFYEHLPLAVADGLLPGGGLSVAPGLRGMYNDAYATGLQYQALRDMVVGVDYTHKLANPGVRRVYDGVTLSAFKQFSDNYLLQASYTFSSWRGDWAGPFRPESLPGAPDLTSAFNPASAQVNQDGPLPGDAPHVVKLDAAYVYEWTPRTTVTVGTAFRAIQGGPLSYLARSPGDPSLGGTASYLLPRGSAGRLPWQTTLDLRAGLSRALTSKYTFSATLDLLNLFNRQSAVAVDERYTLDASGVAPIPSGTLADLPGLKNGAGQPVMVNPAFKRALAYTPPLTLRAGVKLSF